MYSGVQNLPPKHKAPLALAMTIMPPTRIMITTKMTMPITGPVFLSEIWTKMFSHIV